MQLQRKASLMPRINFNYLYKFMAIDLTQAQRKTEFWQITTPKTVGPGAYNPPQSAKSGN